ncbi:hypothetical protein PVL29_021548 [Vitis rotundifolia]|uniref:Uncharacterized protein n=1 Tax=Vitis rotundifolia TaxID=103349 RepID=A0AA38YZS2_VITRO|nr:hypothetical protein PVL29_021548 [Vitis rotundifolia]
MGSVAGFIRPMIKLIRLISRNSLRWHGMGTNMYPSSSLLGNIKGQMHALTNPLQLSPLLMVLLEWHRTLIVELQAGIRTC